MTEIAQPVKPLADAAVTSLPSELPCESVSVELAMASSPSLSSSLVTPVYNTTGNSSVNETAVVAGVSGVATTGSPVIASCSSTPTTPHSLGSASSPGLHSDVGVTVHPPPYSAQGPAADLVTAVLPLDSLVQSDTARSHLPPPPKKPLTPYMRFSKSVSATSVFITKK